MIQQYTNYMYMTAHYGRRAGKNNHMELKIKNKHIFWAVENCWQSLDYRFKAQINELVTANSDDDYVQTIQIKKSDFVQIMNAVNSQPQGIALVINPELYDSLKSQLIIAAQQGSDEASEIVMEMESILQVNAGYLEAKLLNGKTQILA